MLVSYLRIIFDWCFGGRFILRGNSEVLAIGVGALALRVYNCSQKDGFAVSSSFFFLFSVLEIVCTRTVLRCVWRGTVPYSIDWSNGFCGPGYNAQSIDCCHYFRKS